MVHFSAHTRTTWTASSKERQKERKCFVESSRINWIWLLATLKLSMLLSRLLACSFIRLFIRFNFTQCVCVCESLTRLYANRNEREKLNETRFTNKFPFIFSISFHRFASYRNHSTKQSLFISYFHFGFGFVDRVCFVFLFAHFHFGVGLLYCTRRKNSFFAAEFRCSLPPNALLHYFSPFSFHFDFSMLLLSIFRWSGVLCAWELDMELKLEFEGKLISDVIDMLCNHFGRSSKIRALACRKVHITHSIAATAAARQAGT